MTASVTSEPLVAATRPKRRDIQGLRAIAVALVFAVHLFYAQVGGGFVGVDVFLVISGYLITNHLAGEVVRTGRIRLLTFWGRRIARLVPAAFVVLVACTAFVLLHQPALSLSDQLRTDAAGSAYVLNWARLTGLIQAPLVGHFWTLSVEEQFYVVWPVLLLVAVLVTRRWNGRARIISVGIVAAGVLLVSLVYARHEIHVNPAVAYQSTLARGWEFAAGGLVAILPVPDWRSRRWTSALFLLLSWGAAAALVVAVLFPGPKDAATSPLTLPWLAVLAACVLVWVGDSDSPWTPQFLLHTGPLQFLGDISYAVYLWHLPMIAIVPSLIGRQSAPVTDVTIAVVSIALATLSKYVIEDPLRRRWAPGKRLWQPFAFAAGGIVVFTILAVTVR